MALTSPLRVAHVVPALFGSSGVVGGAERYALELGRAMATRTVARLVTFGRQPARDTFGDLEVITVGPARYVRGQRTNPFSSALPGALRGADVVHCHQTHVLTSSLTAAYCRLTGRRVFTTDLGGGGWDISGYVATDRWFHGHLHISGYSRKIAGHDGKPWAHVISGGVDTRRFTPDASVARERTALFVGRILPHKGLDDLVSGMPADVPLEIVGPAPDSTYLRSLQALAAGRQIRFRHDLGDADLIAAYRRAWVVILPSVYRTPAGVETRVPELLGQAVLEGMACETPAICTDVASLPEIVTHGTDGLIVPANDPAALGRAVRTLVDDPVRARTMGAAARRTVLSRFTWDAVVERCLQVYSA